MANYVDDQNDANREIRPGRRLRKPAPGESDRQSRLEAALRQRVFQGEWAVGACLPSARALAKEFGVSHGTVRNALAFLQREGLLVGRQGRGHFVAGRPPRQAARAVAVVTATADALEYQATLRQIIGIRAVLNEAGYNLNLAAVQPRPRPPRHFSFMYDPKPIIDVSTADAAIVLGFPDGYVEPLYILARHIPVVSTFQHFHGLGIGSVMFDYASAGFQAIRHLAGLGHREVVVVNVDDKFVSAANWRVGARLAALAYPGLRVETYLVGRQEIGEGEKAARDLLARPEPPAAVVCGSIELALGFWRAASALGVAIPERLSLVSGSDFPPDADVSPPVTAIHMDFAWLGRRAARMALDLAANPDLSPAVQLLEVELRVCGSTRPSPGGSGIDGEP